MKNFKLLSLWIQFLVVNILITNFVLSQTVNQEWVKTYNGSAFESQGNDIATDNSGNIYVVGYSYISPNNRDFLIIKYNTSGQEMWTRTYSSNSFNSGSGLIVKVDYNQDIILCGFEGLSNVLVLIKYNSSGDTIWTKRYLGDQSVSFLPLNMKVDDDGSIYLSLTTAVGGYDDYTVLKYLSNGNLQWERHYSYELKYHDTANDIVLGNNEYFYIASFSSSETELIGLVIKYNKISGDSVWSNRNENFLPKSIIFDTQGMIYTTGDKDGKYYTSKINPNGESIWNKIYNDSGGIATEIGIDANNNIYVSGYKFSDPPRITILKYNSNGDVSWIRTETGAPYTNCYVSSMFVDEEGNSYIGGTNSQLFPSRDFLTIKHNNNGDMIWLMRYNSTGDYPDYINSLTKDIFDNIIVTGRSSGNPEVCTTIKYSQTIGINLISNQIPVNNYLEQNYPNPFNPGTIINYELGITNFVTLKIYDAIGNYVATLVNHRQNAGSYEVEFDGDNFPTGIYFYKIQAGNFVETKKMILLK